MKILITGGSGFVGSHLCDFLLQEHHEIVIAIKSENKQKNIEHILSKIKVIKVGKLLRKEIHKRTKIGLKIKDSVERGDLAPDELVDELVRKEIKKSKRGLS